MLTRAHPPPQPCIGAFPSVGVGRSKRAPRSRALGPARSRTSCSLLTSPMVAAATVAAVGAAVPLGVLVDAQLDRGKRVEQLSNVATAQGTRAYVARPSTSADGVEATPAPVVLVLHQFFGLRQREVDMCDELATLGYVAVAPDMFEGNSTAFIPRAIWLAFNAALRPGATWSVPAITDVVDHLRTRCEWADTERMCVAGFCVGGGAALRYADAVPAAQAAPAVVVFYGRPLEAVRGLRGPVLGIFGTQDSQFPAAQVDAFEALLGERRIDASILRFEGEGHAFVTDLAATRAPGAAQDAWAAFTKFLATHLK